MPVSKFMRYFSAIAFPPNLVSRIFMRPEKELTASFPLSHSTLAASFSSELRRYASFCAPFHLSYSAQFENCAMKVSNELCPSNFGGFRMCFGDAKISSSDELPGLASSVLSSRLLGKFFRVLCFLSFDEVLPGVLVNYCFLLRLFS